jgi:murein DD-endopeptidase MepM/ murein hydrolase activator NlpD
MPVKEGKKTKVGLIEDFKEFNSKALSKSWYVLSFDMNEGDTVYAARGGVVSAAGPGTVATRNGERTTNSVEVFHSDGTFGKYDLLKGGSLLPKPGTRIIAGDPIGIIDKVYESTYLVFMVYYLDSELINISGNFATAEYSSFKPRFALTEKMGGYIDAAATYSVVKPVSVITREMKKKELEKFRSTQKR